jgi:hypothetical protein
MCSSGTANDAAANQSLFTHLALGTRFICARLSGHSHAREGHLLIACPSCRRRVFTRRNMLYAALDGTARCRVCGRSARLDMLSRWLLSCVLAVLLPAALLYANVFYSGHLYVFSIVVVLGAWRALSILGLPYLTLEAVPERTDVDRKASAFALGAMLLAAVLLDGFIASRIDAEMARESGREVSAAQQSH